MEPAEICPPTHCHFENCRIFPYALAMNKGVKDGVVIRHNRVPERIRLRVPLIKQRPTIADLLTHGLLKDPEAVGIYHAEANVVTGTLLVKYHPALHSEADVVERVRTLSKRIADGDVPITAKHRNPRVSKMQPGAYFSRELLVSIAGNVIAGLLLAAFIAR